MIELSDRYILTSNRESGFRRYEVMLEPRKPKDVGIIIEFKVQDISQKPGTAAPTPRLFLPSIVTFLFIYTPD